MLPTLAISKQEIHINLSRNARFHMGKTPFVREVGFTHKSMLLPMWNGRLALELLQKLTINAHLQRGRPMIRSALVVSFCHVMRRLHRINKHQPSDIAAKSRLGGCESSRNTASDSRCKVRPTKLEALIMLNHALADEVRNNGVAFAARFNNDVAAICNALNDKEQASGRVVVDRAARRVIVGVRQSAGTANSKPGL